jgi:hypothetical protein
MNNMKKIILQKNVLKAIDDQNFYLATNGEKASQTTEVSLKYDENYLTINFNCLQNTFVNENTYFENNTDMWNQEVFELFIGAGNETPEHYLEIEINPNNALFVAKINNPTKKLAEIAGYLSQKEASILHGVQKQIDSWNGFFSIPIELLGKNEKQFRINFYRIVSKVSHQNPNWQCSEADCDFMCWSSTMSGTEPSFHRPEMFGILEFKD